MSELSYNLYSSFVFICVSVATTNPKFSISFARKTPIVMLVTLVIVLAFVNIALFVQPLVQQKIIIIINILAVLIVFWVLTAPYILLQNESIRITASVFSTIVARKTIIKEIIIKEDSAIILMQNDQKYYIEFQKIKENQREDFKENLAKYL